MFERSCQLFQQAVRAYTSHVNCPRSPMSALTTKTTTKMTPKLSVSYRIGVIRLTNPWQVWRTALLYYYSRRVPALFSAHTKVIGLPKQLCWPARYWASLLEVTCRKRKKITDFLATKEEKQLFFLSRKYRRRYWHWPAIITDPDYPWWSQLTGMTLLSCWLTPPLETCVGSR